MKYLILMLFSISSAAVSAAEQGKQIHSFRLNPNRFFFLSIDDGVKGKFAESTGLQPVRVFANRGAEVKYLIVEAKPKTGKPGEGGYDFFISADEKISDDDEKISAPYDLDARIAKVSKKRDYSNDAPAVVTIDGVQCASFPFCSVASEIYSISLFESDSLEKLKKLPISPLFPLFSWPKTETDI